MEQNDVSKYINNKLINIINQNNVFNNKNESLVNKRNTLINIKSELNSIIKIYNINIRNINNNIQKSCNHNYIRDEYDYDPCRTLYICSICGKNK